VREHGSEPHPDSVRTRQVSEVGTSISPERRSLGVPAEQFLRAPLAVQLPAWTDLIEEDADIRQNLVALGEPALSELCGILEGTQPYHDLRAIVARPPARELATLLAMADTDEVVRLLRATGKNPRQRGSCPRDLDDQHRLLACRAR
jgi:hypothetical protein